MFSKAILCRIISILSLSQCFQKPSCFGLSELRIRWKGVTLDIYFCVVLIFLHFFSFTVKPQQTATPYKKPSAPISSGPIKPRPMMQPMVSPKSAPDVLKTGKEESDIQVQSFITLSLSQRTSFKLFQTERACRQQFQF